jgi:hypothetical protein
MCRKIRTIRAWTTTYRIKAGTVGIIRAVSEGIIRTGQEG